MVRLYPVITDIRLTTTQTGHPFCKEDTKSFLKHNTILPRRTPKNPYPDSLSKCPTCKTEFAIKLIHPLFLTLAGPSSPTKARSSQNTLSQETIRDAEESIETMKAIGDDAIGEEITEVGDRVHRVATRMRAEGVIISEVRVLLSVHEIKSDLCYKALLSAVTDLQTRIAPSLKSLESTQSMLKSQTHENSKLKHKLKAASKNESSALAAAEEGVAQVSALSTKNGKLARELDEVTNKLNNTLKEMSVLKGNLEAHNRAVKLHENKMEQVLKANDRLSRDNEKLKERLYAAATPQDHHVEESLMIADGTFALDDDIFDEVNSSR